ncbi:MAG TPA: GAF domain-containing protein, partial [Myxococcaceae bacterium]|nr:GAF domain-containing protein [Myxococcaceae bacterium]
SRVFRIREMSEAELASAKVKPRPTPIGTPLPVEPAAPPPGAVMVEPVSKAGSPESPVAGVRTAAPGSLEPTLVRPPDRPTGAAAARPTPMSTPRVILPQTDELFAPQKPPTGPIGRRKPARSPAAQMEDVLAEVFERVQGVYQRRDAADGLGFLLDLAMEKIPVEAGSVFASEMVSGDLRFVVVRGPKAQDILDAKIVIPAGTGIVGFCAVEGVSLGLSDVQKDPRFYRGVSDRVHYETRSILCSPVIAHGRTFGCMELVNRRESPMFTEYEVGMLSYIAHQGALFLDTLG